MAGGAATRGLIDIAVAVSLVGALVGALVETARLREPRITTCESLAGAPRYDAWHVPITVAAVFGVIEDERDPGAWSYHAFEVALEARGFSRVGPDRYASADMIVDVVPPLPRDPSTVAPVLTAELATHDLVYYDGHDFDGDMHLTAPALGYHLIVLDSCWSTQHYSPTLLGPHVDVVGNTERSVTGSVESFVAFLDGIRRRAAWADLIGSMNDLAAARLPTRPARPKLDRAEHYRHDLACR